MPDVLIGRIPAHTPSEVEIVSGKIVSYDQSAAVFADWQGKAMLVSEYDGSMDFFTPHNYIYDEHFTGGSPTAEKVYEGNPDPPPCNEAAEAERMLIASNVNGGAAVLSVVSHGNWLVWGGGCTFFEVKSPPPSGEPCPAYDLDDPRCDDLDLHTNGTKLQFHVHANCLPGAFEADSPVSATIDSQYSFFEDWLVTAGKGAVAGIAPSSRYVSRARASTAAERLTRCSPSGPRTATNRDEASA